MIKLDIIGDFSSKIFEDFFDFNLFTQPSFETISLENSQGFLKINDCPRPILGKLWKTLSYKNKESMNGLNNTAVILVGGAILAWGGGYLLLKGENLLLKAIGTPAFIGGMAMIIDPWGASQNISDILKYFSS